MNPSSHASKLTYAGLFTVTLATLMHEVLLMRIFSVTMWLSRCRSSSATSGVSGALTKFLAQVSRLYGANLGGCSRRVGPDGNAITWWNGRCLRDEVVG